MLIKCSLIEELVVEATTFGEPSILFSKNSVSENSVLFCFCCIAIYKNATSISKITQIMSQGKINLSQEFDSLNWLNTSKEDKTACTFLVVFK